VLIENKPATRIIRRNFQLGVLNGLMFSLAEKLMDPTLVLVAFVSHLTPSAVWLGFLVPLNDGGWFLPQLLVSSFLQSWPFKIHLYRCVAVVRLIAWTLLVAAVFLIKDPAWLLIAFFLTFGLTSIASGFSGLAFLEVVGKTVPARRRGEFFAWRLATGGLAGIGGSVLVSWLLAESGPLKHPYNFGAMFALALVFAAIGLLAFSLIVEPEDKSLRPPASIVKQLQRASQILSADGNFRRFISLRSALMIAGAATPFFAVHVQQQLGGSLEMIGLYLGVFTIFNLSANVLLGRFSARLGNRHTMTLAVWAGVCMTGLVLLLTLLAGPLRLGGWAASLWLVPVFAASGIRESGIGVAGQSLLLDIAPRDERSLYLGFTNTFLGIVMFLSGLSGLVVARFGFLALLLVTAAAHLFALHSALRMRDSAKT
jgi:MFS family permease